MVPLFAAVFFSGAPNAYMYAVIVFIAAGLTDVLDGMIARKYGLVTRLGRILDPLADKLIVFCTIICASYVKLIPWWVIAVYLVKEIGQAIGSIFVFKKIKDMPQSNILGKSATISFYIVIASIILFDNMPYTVKTGLLVISLLLAFSALVSYAVRAVKIVKK